MTEISPSSLNGQAPVIFESGNGIWLFDTDGNKYFDTFCGLAVSSLGHTNSEVTKAIKDQAGRLVECSHRHHNRKQAGLATALLELSGMDQVYFSNSGTEANEMAIKIANRHAHDRGIAAPKIIVMTNAFHGSSSATLAASHNNKYRLGFVNETIEQNYIRVPFNDAAALSQAFAQHSDIAAIMLEPVQFESGVHVCDAAFMQAARQLCTENKALLIVDEVHTGNGRTGKYFAFEHAEVRPDLLTLSKGLANGYPLGACLAAGSAAKVKIPSTPDTNFQGNTLACAAAVAVVEQIKKHDLVARSEMMGKRIMDRLHEELGSSDYIKRIEGQGLMIGIEMDEPCFALVPLAKAKGILLNVTSENVIRLLPPLNISDEECEFLIEACVTIIRLYAADDRSSPRS